MRIITKQHNLIKDNISNLIDCKPTYNHLHGTDNPHETPHSTTKQQKSHIHHKQKEDTTRNILATYMKVLNASSCIMGHVRSKCIIPANLMEHTRARCSINSITLHNTYANMVHHNPTYCRKCYLWCNSSLYYIYLNENGEVLVDVKWDQTTCTRWDTAVQHESTCKSTWYKMGYISSHYSNRWTEVNHTISTNMAYPT